MHRRKVIGFLPITLRACQLHLTVALGLDKASLHSNFIRN
jgi:hypothetical protein